MRILGIVFFVLLALKLVLRYTWPTPAPAWSRIAIIACCVGIIVCLILQTLSERAEQAKDDQTPDSQ